MTGPHRPTAFVSSNDLGAIDLLDCADHLAIPVPRKLSVVGFDDVMMAGLARINLTTIAQPKEMLARLAVDTLASRIEGHLTRRSHPPDGELPPHRPRLDRQSAGIAPIR